MRWSSCASLLFVLGSARLLAQEHAGMAGPVMANEPLAIESVLAEIQRSNPQLQGARTRWEAAKERMPQAAAWADPMVGVDVERSNRRLTSYHDAEWTVSQAIPVSGKIQNRKQVVTADISAAEATLQQLELDLESRARAGYIRLADAEAQLAINAQSQALLGQLIEITRSKYESGRQRQSDVLMAETELAQLAETRVDQLRTYSEAQSALNLLMNRAPQTPLGHATLPEFTPLASSLEALQARAAAFRPQLANADSRIAAAQARVAVAESERRADPEFRLEARQFNGTALYNLREYDTGVFIRLPWANRGRYSAAIREAKKNVEAEQHDRRALESETATLVRDVWQRLQTFNHHVELFHDRLLPLARQSVDATRTSYEADRATLPELLATQRTQQEVESMYAHHLSEYFIARAELVPFVGTIETVAPAAVRP